MALITINHIKSHGFFMVIFYSMGEETAPSVCEQRPTTGQQLRVPAQRGVWWPMTLGPLHRNSGGASQNVFWSPIGNGYIVDITVMWSI